MRRDARAGRRHPGRRGKRRAAGRRSLIALNAAVALVVSAGSSLPAATQAAEWLAPVSLSVSAAEAGGDAVLPQVAMSSRGAAVVVWQRYDGGASVIEAARSLDGRKWTRPVRLSQPRSRRRKAA